MGTSNFPVVLSLNQDSDNTGEPGTLKGRIDKKNMGNRASRDKPKLLPGSETYDEGAADRAQHHSILADKIDDSLLYRPRTKENRLLYEQVLARLYTLLEDQPQDVLYSVADEVLAVLKADGIVDAERKIEVESLIGEKITSDYFIDLYAVAKQITDYKI